MVVMVMMTTMIAQCDVSDGVGRDAMRCDALRKGIMMTTRTTAMMTMMVFTERSHACSLHERNSLDQLGGAG
jgi:hypothetical protein